MPTSEERFATLESFRTETIKAYGEMAMELAMVKGLTSDAIGRLAVLQRDVSEIKATVNEHTELLKQILDRLPPAKE
jgi:hypothetical protein